MRATHQLLAFVMLATSAVSRVAVADAPPALAPSSAPPPTDGWRQLRFTSGVTLTTIGTIMLITGGVLGVRAIVDKNQIQPGQCNRAFQCNLNGYTLGFEAGDFAITSDVMFAVGGLVTVVGVSLFATALPPKPVSAARASVWETAWVGVSRRGVTLGAAW